jgi:hypothetical protein
MSSARILPPLYTLATDDIIQLSTRQAWQTYRVDQARILEWIMNIVQKSDRICP